MTVRHYGGHAFRLFGTPAMRKLFWARSRHPGIQLGSIDAFKDAGPIAGRSILVPCKASGKWTAKLRVEKTAENSACSVALLQIESRDVAKKAALCGISARSREQFSELQTEWRGKSHSNPPLTF